jgi:hypothetical protein
MHVLAGVFFQVQACQAHLQRSPVSRVPGFVARRGHNLQAPMLGERTVILRDLVAFRQVRVKVVFARENGSLVDVEREPERRPRGELDDAAVEYGQCAGQAEADRTGIGVRLVAEARRATAENLRFRVELRVYLEADDGLPAFFHHKSAVDSSQ